MHRPSLDRVAFEAELQARPDFRHLEWEAVACKLGKSDVNALVTLVEDAADWPPGKLLPNDPIRILFHGKADEDMPFGRFRTDVRNRFGIVIQSYQDVVSSLPENRQTIQGLIELILDRQQRAKESFCQ